MDDGVGCVVAIIFIAIVVASCEPAAAGFANNIGKSIADTFAPVLVLSAFVLVGAVLASGYALIVVAYENKQKEKKRKEKLDQEQKRKQAIDTLLYEVDRHFEAIQTMNEDARQAYWEDIQSQFRRSISLLKSDESGQRRPFFSWKGVKGVKGTVYLYRGRSAHLFQRRIDVVDKIGEQGLLATRQLSKSGTFVDRSVSSGEYSYYIFWRAIFDGVKPVVIINGERRHSYSREDLAGHTSLSKDTYRETIFGGFKAERLFIPSQVDPLDDQERKYQRAVRKADLEERWKRLKGDDLSKLDRVERAKQLALKSAEEEQQFQEDLNTAIAEIHSDDSFTDAQKEQVIAKIEKELAVAIVDSDGGWEDG